MQTPELRRRTGSKAQDSTPTTADQEEAPAQGHLPGTACKMGPRSQLSGDHGQLEALCHVNTSVLAPEGHELFLGRGSANFLTVGMGLGRGSCWGP